jgi:hypothetical protein
MAIAAAVAFTIRRMLSELLLVAESSFAWPPEA